MTNNTGHGRTYESTCEGKDKLTAKVARGICRRMKRSGRAKVALTTYKCPHCGFYHVGRQFDRKPILS